MSHAHPALRLRAVKPGQADRDAASVSHQTGNARRSGHNRYSLPGRPVWSAWAPSGCPPAPAATAHAADRLPRTSRNRYSGRDRSRAGQGCGAWAPSLPVPRGGRAAALKSLTVDPGLLPSESDHEFLPKMGATLVLHGLFAMNQVAFMFELTPPVTRGWTVDPGRRNQGSGVSWQHKTRLGGDHGQEPCPG